MNRASGGLLLVVLAAILGIAWFRGYLASWIGTATSILQGQATKNPIQVPGATSELGASAGGGRGNLLASASASPHPPTGSIA